MGALLEWWERRSFLDFGVGLGEKFTSEVSETWTAAYGLLVDVMQFGALEAEA